MSIATVPDLRRPPHDPLTLVIGGRLGWPTLGGDDVGPSLQLARFPDSLPRLTEPSGSMGGLRPPGNVAVTAGGDVWLLTRDGRLQRFDVCACRFVDVPCGLAPGSGGMPGVRGLAAAAGHLFVCDPDHGRVQVVVTPAMAVSAVLRAPMDWRPTGVVVDDRMRVHVVDPENRMVHHFGWSGRYRGGTPGTGDAVHIAATRDGDLLLAGPSGAHRRGADGRVTPVTEQVEDLRDQLHRAPFEVSADGVMHLGVQCDPPHDELWFDPDGLPTHEPPSPAQLWERSRSVVIGPLDSRIDECVWDRITLLGDIPETTTVALDTLTAQIPLTSSEVANLPDTAWDTRLTCSGLERGAWDGLVRGASGRYLWLRLGLTGNGLVTPRLDEAVVDFPRVSLRRYLPAVFGAEPTSADFTDRLLAIFDRTLREVEGRIDDLPALLDPRSTSHLDWLAGWIGIRPDRRLPERFRREQLADAGHLMDLRGTVAGLRRLLVLALGMDRVADGACDPEDAPDCAGCLCAPPRETCPPRPVPRARWQPPPLILEHFRLRRWFEAGASRLGDCTVLWGQSIVNRTQLGVHAVVGTSAMKGTQDPARDSFHVYAHRFTVFVPAGVGATPERRRALEQLVAWGSPAHTVGEVDYVAPRFRVGVQASIGLNTVVARLPGGVTLGDTRLGPASVLDGDGRHSIDTSAVGTTAVLG